jgi:hypothetical protein
MKHHCISSRTKYIAAQIVRAGDGPIEIVIWWLEGVMSTYVRRHHSAEDFTAMTEWLQMRLNFAARVRGSDDTSPRNPPD